MKHRFDIINVQIEKSFHDFFEKNYMKINYYIKIINNSDDLGLRRITYGNYTVNKKSY